MVMLGVATTLTTHRVDAVEPSPADPSTRLSLTRNFSIYELATIGGVGVASVVLAAAGTHIFGQPSPSLGAPAPNSFDHEWSDRLHFDDGSGHRFLWGVPDHAGLYVLPYTPLVVYGVDAIAFHRSGEGWLSSDPNADHRFAAYAEAIGWTMLVTNVTKFVVGRERPYVVLEHPELAGPTRESRLSFFSGHSAATFATASFVSMDISRRLSSGWLASASPLERWFQGTAIPYATAFGVASLVGVSRVIDQQHWATDVLIGATVGTSLSRVVYVSHFDEQGNPRSRRAPSGWEWPRVLPTRNGISVSGSLP